MLLTLTAYAQQFVRSMSGTDFWMASLITARRVIFTPSKEVKDELQGTKISITCYDKDGNIVKRVTSTDTNDVEDTEGEENGGSQNTGGNSGGNSGGGTGSITPSGGDNNGGGNGGGGFESEGD